MDEERRRLERATRSDPIDIQAAKRLDLVLARACDREGLRRRYRAKFLCPLKFEELAPTADPLERACGRCRRDVRFVRTEEELAERVAARECVAFLRRDLGRVLDLAIDGGRLHSAAEPGRPCFVPTDLPFVDLDRVEVDARVLDVLGSAVIDHYGALPIAADPDVVFVALADPSAEGVVRDLEREAGREVRPVLADPAALARALRRHEDRDLARHLFGWFEEWRPPPARAIVRERRGRADDD